MGRSFADASIMNSSNLNDGRGNRAADSLVNAAHAPLCISDGTALRFAKREGEI